MSNYQFFVIESGRFYLEKQINQEEATILVENTIERLQHTEPSLSKFSLCSDITVQTLSNFKLATILLTSNKKCNGNRILQICRTSQTALSTKLSVSNLDQETTLKESPSFTRKSSTTSCTKTSSTLSVTTQKLS